MSNQDDPASSPNAIAILPSSERYLQQMEDVMATVYNLNPNREEDGIFNVARFRRQHEVFPEGQFIALDTRIDKVVGFTVSMRVNFSPTEPLIASWWDLIGQGWLSTHVPDGEWLYGVESAVHPDYQGKGIGKRLTNARLDTMRKLNLRGMVAGSAIVSYHTVADTVPVEEYVADVIAGRRFDNNLTKQLKMGFKPVHIIPNYLEDEDCAGYGVEVIIENPAYIPAHPARSLQSTALMQPGAG